jgi:hypothetical protein
MQANYYNHLKTAAELVQQASDLLRDCSEMDVAASDALREKLIGEILRIKLTTSVMRRNLSLIVGAVNRRKHRMVRASSD